MALPTGNLTLHLDASVNTDLWVNNTAGSFSTHPADGAVVEWWDDVEHADIVGDAQSGPLWQSSSPLMLLPCISFDGSQYYELSNNADTVNKTLGDVVTASAFTLFLSFYVVSVTLNDANAYNNEALIADGGAYWGVFLKNTGSGYQVQSYVWDGAAKVINTTIALSTSYTLMVRLESGTLYTSLNGAAESSLASGNIASTASNVQIAAQQSIHHPTCRIGEVALYNAALTGTNLTDAASYFTRWVSTGSIGSATAAGLATGVSNAPALTHQFGLLGVG